MIRMRRIAWGGITLLGYIVIGWLAFVRPDWLLWASIFTILTTILLVIICFIPAGGVVLGNPQAKLPIKNWFIALAKGQLALIMLTIAAFCAFFNKGPSYAQITFPLTDAIEIILKYSQFEWGIFPWAVYSLWGITIAYIVYVKRGNPYLYQIAQGLVPFRFEPMIKTFVESVTTGTMILVFSLVAATIVLLLTSIIENKLAISHFQVPFITIMVFSFLSLLFSLKHGRKLLRMLIKKITLIRLYGALIILTLIMLVLAAVGNQWIVKHFYLFYQRAVCHQCGNYFANVPFEIRFAITYWGWWLMWTPLAGSYIAAISQGRTLRQVILGVFIFPLCGGLIGWLIGPAPLLACYQKLSLYPNLVFFLLAMISSWLFYRLLVVCSNSDSLIIGYMPLNTEVKRSRLWLMDASKAVGWAKYSQKIFMTLIGILFLHATAGWYGVQFQLAAMGGLLINIVYSNWDLLIWCFFKDKTWQNLPAIAPYRQKKLPKSLE